MFQITPARISSTTCHKNMLVMVEDKTKLTTHAKQVDKMLSGQLTRTLKISNFTGKKGSITTMLGLEYNEIENILVLGVGKYSSLTRADWFKLGVSVGQKLKTLNIKDISFLMGRKDTATKSAGKETMIEASTAFIEGLQMASYNFDTYKSKDSKAESKSKFKGKFSLLTDGSTSRKLKETLPDIKALIESQAKARTAVNQPPNVAGPEYMVKEAKKLAKMGIIIEILDEKQIEKLGMNLIMAVGKNASKADQPRLIIMKYNGAKKSEPYKAIVGKGVMYDTGGYSLKPSNYMKGMKMDMGGAAAVLGTMEAIARRKPKINVVGVIGCVMNMIGENPYVPDSIYTAYNGKTVEIGNTDAEGRLVLADAMAYTIDKFKPSEIIDLATLTGAIMVALAGRYGGLFSNKTSLAKKLHKAGEDTGERLWRMPIDEEFVAKSDWADINNDGAPYGGSSVAALFIKQFVGDTPWAHLDIAGVAQTEKKGCSSYLPSITGATGFGVRLLTNYLEGEAKRK